jgi:hypothetical protein
MVDLPTSRIIGADFLTRAVLQWTKRDLPMPTAVGLERNGQVLIKPYCPPYYPNMRAAVEAFVADKYAAGNGIFRDGGVASGWQDPASIQRGIPPYSDAAIAATSAYCDYVYNRYGRFPANGGPFRTVLAYQAHHLDPDFYARFYRPDALSATQREHQATWHST